MSYVYFRISQKDVQRRHTRQAEKIKLENQHTSFMSKLESEKSILQQTVESLENTNTHTSNKLEVLKEDNDNLQKQISELRRSNENAKQKLHERGTDINGLKKKLYDLEKLLVHMLLDKYL